MYCVQTVYGIKASDRERAKGWIYRNTSVKTAGSQERIDTNNMMPRVERETEFVLARCPVTIGRL